MAIIPNTQFPGKTAGTNTNYPYGQARDVTTSGDGTGTPWVAALANDLFGFQQALLQAAGIAPSGSPDTAVASQYLQAIQALIAAVPRLGFDQTWQDVTASRSNNTEYVNNTGATIQVFISVNFSGSADELGHLYLDGVDIKIRDAAAWSHLSFPVPPGGTYRINAPMYSLLTWAELRAT